MKKTAIIHQLEWSGDMKKITVKTKPYDDTLIEVDEWYSPKEGELCLYEGKIGYVRKIRWQDPDNMLKGGYRYLTSVEDIWVSEGFVNRVNVLEGKEFKIGDKTWTFVSERDNDDEKNRIYKSIIEITRKEKIEAIPLINEAYYAGINAFEPMADYYNNLKDKSRKHPHIVNPYEKLDITFYHRFEVIKSFEAGYKRADELYMSKIFG